MNQSNLGRTNSGLFVPTDSVHLQRSEADREAFSKAINEVSKKSAEAIDQWMGECLKRVLPAEVIRIFEELPSSENMTLTNRLGLYMTELPPTPGNKNRVFVFFRKEPHSAKQILMARLTISFERQDNAMHLICQPEASAENFVVFDLGNVLIRRFLRLRRNDAPFVEDAYQLSCHTTFAAPYGGAPIEAEPKETPTQKAILVTYDKERVCAASYVWISHDHDWTAGSHADTIPFPVGSNQCVIENDDIVPAAVRALLEEPA